MSALLRPRSPSVVLSTAGRRRPSPYALLCAVLAVWAVLLVWQHRWGQDIRLHYATLYALERDLWHPGDPMVGGPSSGPYFSPYMLMLALVGKAGVSATNVFGLAALGNFALFLWAFRRFARHLSAKSSVAALGLIFTLLLWGWSSYGWSGFLDLRSVATELPYPSMLGLGLMFLVWDGLLRFRDSPAPSALAVTAVVAALLVLVHPFSALNAGVGAAAIFLGSLRLLRRRELLLLAAALGVVALLVISWPYSDLTSLFRGSAEFSRIHRPLMRGAFSRYGLALIGLPALVLGWKRPLGRELLLIFAGGTALVAYARFGHSYAYARALPIYGLPLQLALARHLGDPARPGSIFVRWYGVAVGCVAVIACMGALPGVLPVIPGKVDLGTRQWRIPAGVPDEDWSFLTRHLRRGEVVMTAPRGGGIANRFGIYSVSPAWPDPFVPDEGARRAASATFFDAATGPDVRLQLADRYHVRCLLTAGPFDPASYPTFHQVDVRGSTVLACR